MEAEAHAWAPIQVVTASGTSGRFRRIGCDLGDDRGRRFPVTNGSGTVYVYVYDGTAWKLQQALSPSTMDQSFGFAVAIAGDSLLVGTGGLYGYRRSNGKWSGRGDGVDDSSRKRRSTKARGLSSLNSLPTAPLLGGPR
jgi:hypothetical protein